MKISKWLLRLHAFNALSAIGGGIAMITGVIEEPVWVEHTSFETLYFPGVILLSIVGGSSLIAALSIKKNALGWQMASISAGTIMMIWIIGEIASIRTFHFLQIIYFTTGLLAVIYVPVINKATNP